jgi:hypothetical protein
LQSIAKGEHMDVYVIQVGQYSDKTLVAAASTEERAEEIVEAMKKFYDETDHWFTGDEFNIHKFELDALPVYVDQVIFEVTYYSDRDNWVVDRVTYGDFDELRLNTVETWNSYDDPKRPGYRVLLAVNDEKTALKAGTERILQFIAKENRNGT